MLGNRPIACAATPVSSAAASSPGSRRARWNGAAPAQPAGAGRGVARQHAAGREDEVDDARAVIEQRLHQAAPAFSVRPQSLTGRGEVPVGEGGPAAVERVGIADIRIQQFDAARAEVELAEEVRGRGHRMHRGAHVVQDVLVEERLAAQPAADVVGAFVQFHLQACACQRDRGREPVGTGADAGGVDAGHARSPSLLFRRAPGGEQAESDLVGAVGRSAEPVHEHPVPRPGDCPGEGRRIAGRPVVPQQRPRRLPGRRRFAQRALEQQSGDHGGERARRGPQPACGQHRPVQCPPVAFSAEQAPRAQQPIGGRMRGHLVHPQWGEHVLTNQFLVRSPGRGHEGRTEHGVTEVGVLGLLSRLPHGDLPESAQQGLQRVPVEGRVGIGAGQARWQPLQARGVVRQVP